MPLLSALRELIARSLARPDFVPAGRALSLAARIEERELHCLPPTDLADREALFEDAFRDAREALAIFEHAGQRTPRLEPLWVLGRLELLRGREEAARAYFERCRQIALSARVDDFREHALLGLVSIAERSGDLPAVEILLGELSSFRTPDDCWPLAREHAERLLHEDLPSRAAEFLIRHRPEDAAERSSWRLALGIARLRQGDLDGARALFEELEGGPDDQDRILAGAALALAEGRADDVVAALEWGGPAESFTSQGRVDALALLGEALLLQHQPDLALEALIDARELAEGWEARLERQRPLAATGATVFGEWFGLHAVSLEARALNELDRPREAALAIERAHSSEWRERSGLVLTTQDLEAWAASYEHGLVTWISGANVGLAVHLAADGRVSAIEIPYTRRQLKRAVRRFRESLLRGDEPAMTRLSKELSSALLPATLLAELLGGDGEGRLLCLAHGPIESLPLEALELEGVPVDELAAVLVLPGFPVGRPGTRPAGETGWRLLGDPLDASGGTMLPAANEELSEIAALRRDAVMESGAQFTREACLDALSSGASLHFATHLGEELGCDSSRFSAVGLRLSRDEALCATDVFASTCTSPLVVLSACDTSGGRFVDARGLQGVAHAFLEAGARDLLVTLWPVEDRSARLFTPAFHRALLEGLSPSRAARRARGELARNGGAAADWAAFRVLGRD